MRAYFLWLAKLLTLVIVFFFFVPLVIAGLIAALTRGGLDTPGEQKNLVALVKLEGMITESHSILESLYKQVQDKNIKGIVLRINSPGGAVGPSQDIYHAVGKLKAKKPIVASIGSVAASGGLYAALGASKVYSQPGSLTGSIGVILQVPNVKKMTDSVGFEMVTIKSGALKDVGNSFREMTPDEKQFLQSTVGAVHEDFVNAVVTSRKLERDKVLQFSDGRVLVGTQAKELGLVDEFGDVYDAARAVFDLKGEPLPEGEIPRLLDVADPFSGFVRLVESAKQLPSMLMPQFNLRYSMY